MFSVSPQPATIQLVPGDGGIKIRWLPYIKRFRNDYQEIFLNTQSAQNKFAAFMSLEMSDGDWFALLKDFDNLEHYCKIGYMGAYHLNIPFIAKLNDEETAEFYLKKEQLYQSKYSVVLN